MVSGTKRRESGRRWHSWLQLCLFWILLFAAGSVQAQETPTQGVPAPLSPVLSSQLAEHDGRVSFLVVLAAQPDLDAALDRERLRGASREERAWAIYTYLAGFARQSQAPLRRWLDANGVPYRVFYIVNALEVQGDAALVEALRRRPDVGRLAANPAIRLELPAVLPVAGGRSPALESVSSTPQAAGSPYGIQFSRAPAVWDLGIRGEGIVVASQDTGVYWQHPALRDHYRGWDAETETATHAYNWADAWGSSGRPASCDSDPQVPCDDGHHGTHTVGTILGDDGEGGEAIVGMAPDARWIGCRNMNQGVGTPASYMACFEFFLAPYPQGGSPEEDGRPDLAPHIVNNSWYCPPSEGCDLDSLQQVVDTVRAAGQMVVASAGNNGPGCGSVRYPTAVYDGVFSVGAHDSSGGIASFSSRGPVGADGSGRLKPQLAAPGVGVRSTVSGGGYGLLNGTSMASPHVAGAVALLWSAAPELIGDLDMTEQILLKSATPLPDGTCEEGSLAAVPNNTYGYGYLDALAAVQMAQQPATVTITVTSLGIGPASGTTVEIVDDLTGYHYSAQTDADGVARFGRLFAGVYWVTLVALPGGEEPFELNLEQGEHVELMIEVGRRLYLPWVVQG